MTALGDAIAVVEAFCAEQGIGRQDALRLAFIVEELFTNTVTHGHGADCAEPITLGLVREEATVGLTFADTAPAHNPLQSFDSDAASLVTSLQMRPVGGLGTYLIGQLIETGRYRREDGRNILELHLPLEG